MHNHFPTSLCLIIFVSAFVGISQASKLSGLPLLNAYTSTNGKVKLYSDSYGYYVYTDYQYEYYADSDSEDMGPTSTTGAMKIGLYTSQTWLSSNCLDFTYYSCSSNTCTAYTYDTTSESLPYFTANGYFASADVYLAYNSWSLSPYAAIATSCSSDASSYYGYGRSGIVGMGLANSSYSNFGSTPLFSIYLDRTTQTGELTFDIDQNKKAHPNTPGITLTADSNYHINLGYGFFYIASTYQVSFYYSSMIFDLDSPTIGIPYSEYSDFVSYFAEAAGTTCSSDLMYPTCYYSGTVGNLPNISLYAQSQYIAIPPQVYLENGFGYTDSSYVSQISLNIRALASTLSDDNYVTPAYDGYIIMGSSFLTYYYTAYEYTSSSPGVILNVAAPQIGSNLLWLYITLGVVGFIAFTVCCCCCICKSKRPKGGVQVVPTAYIDPSAQDPLMTNAEGMNLPYNQGPPNYNPYQYGNYPPQPQFTQQPYGNMQGYNYPQPGGVPYQQ